MKSKIEQYYRDNYGKLLKKLTFRAGTVWAAEDVLHTAFERALRYSNSCDPDRFPQWFSMIMNNALRDYLNEERGYSPLEDVVEEAETTDCPHLPRQVRREVFELIDTKSVDQIEVLSLHYKQGYSANDISKITNHSYAKSHQIISRFRAEVRQLYAD